MEKEGRGRTIFVSNGAGRDLPRPELVRSRLRGRGNGTPGSLLGPRQEVKTLEPCISQPRKKKKETPATKANPESQPLMGTPQSILIRFPIASLHAPVAHIFVEISSRSRDDPSPGLSGPLSGAFIHVWMPPPSLRPPLRVRPSLPVPSLPFPSLPCSSTLSE